MFELKQHWAGIVMGCSCYHQLVLLCGYITSLGMVQSTFLHSRGSATYLDIVWVVGAEAGHDIVVVTARLSLAETLGAFLLLERER